MSWLDRFRKPKPVLDDSVFGRVVFEKRYGCWSGSVAFGRQPQTVIVSLDGDAPTDLQRERFREFEARYSELAPAIASELFDLYEPYLGKSYAEGMPDPKSAAELWNLVELDDVNLAADGSITAGYGFRQGAGWKDAMFEIAFEGWKPVGQSLND